MKRLAHLMMALAVVLSPAVLTGCDDPDNNLENAANELGNNLENIGQEMKDVVE